MTPEAQRIAIAEACGYVFEELRVRTPYRTLFSRRRNNGDGTYTDTTCKHLPDYISDLNAMNAAENVLNPSQEQIYFEKLHEVSGGLAFYRATAAQRAEAFLKTLNLWEENK